MGWNRSQPAQKIKTNGSEKECSKLEIFKNVDPISADVKNTDLIPFPEVFYNGLI